MKNHFTKISLFILIGTLFSQCNTLRRVPNGKLLLTNNEIMVNSKKVELDALTELMYQKPNSSILGYRLRLNLFNLANPKHDSTFIAKVIDNPKRFKNLSNLLSEKQVYRLGKSFWYSGFHEFMVKTGEKPVLIDSLNTAKSSRQLSAYYRNRGFLNAKTTFSIDSVAERKGKVNYQVTTGVPFMIDTVRTTILTPVLDSIYNSIKAQSFIKPNTQFAVENFEKERSRITNYFRNNGAYTFQQNYVSFEPDTLVTPKKANVNIKINNYSYRENDTTKTAPFKIYKISDVNIITDYSSNKSNLKFKDSVSYKNFNVYSYGKLKYKPRAITDAVFITNGSDFSDNNTTLTSRYLSNLKIFNYPSITYKVDPRDSLANTLIASIYLSPRKKYSVSANLDITHSNIQDLGIALSPSLAIRNVFNRAETFEISGRGNIGASKHFANPDDNFFNVLEYGLDARLNFPRIFMFFNTEKIIPKRMIPSTVLSVGFSKQSNIGLDKQNLTGIFAYNWTPRPKITSRFELLNIQFIKNINPENYFKVYGTSYNTLNVLANTSGASSAYFNSDNELIIQEGVNSFITDALDPNSALVISETDKKTINSIEERRQRLSEDNLIFATNYQFSITTKNDLNDESFYVFRTKLESAGNLLSGLATISKKLKNQNGANTFLDVEYSQYFKTEFEFIKHWDLKSKRIFAFRSFAGIAVPYKNSNSIPFSRSYFAGGSNDNRGWQPYKLGPGTSSGFNDFNEANLKLSVNAEFRFNIFGDLHGALFADAGNIWNVLDNIDDKEYTFNGIQSLQDMAIASGLGFRYDFSFFVFRLDLGFKTYNPALDENKKWLSEVNLSKSVLNIGINYPF